MSTEAPETIPDSVTPAPRIGESDLRTARILVFVTSLSAIIFAFVAVLGVNLIVSLVAGPGQVSEGEAECQEGYNDDCGDKMVCELGRCVEMKSAVSCQRGDPCGRACANDGTLKCDPATKSYVVAVGGKECSDEKVITFIAALEEKCGNAKSCKSSDFEKFAISKDDFWELVGAFPTTLAVHYPYGKPSTKPTRKGSWPTPEEEKHYIANITPMLPALRSAEFVLLVATASRDKIAGRSDLITYERAMLTKKMVIKAAESEGLNNVEQQLLEDKLKVVQIGDAKLLDVSEFRGLFGSRSVAWSDKVQEHLRNLLELGDEVKDGKSRLFRDRTINQTVFIVPIPCSSSLK